MLRTTTGPSRSSDIHNLCSRKLLELLASSEPTPALRNAITGELRRRHRYLPALDGTGPRASDRAPS